MQQHLALNPQTAVAATAAHSLLFYLFIFIQEKRQILLYVASRVEKKKKDPAGERLFDRRHINHSVRLL
jgi:hypothetical protein